MSTEVSVASCSLQSKLLHSSLQISDPISYRVVMRYRRPLVRSQTRLGLAGQWFHIKRIALFLPSTDVCNILPTPHIQKFRLNKKNGSLSSGLYPCHNSKLSAVDYYNSRAADIRIIWQWRQQSRDHERNHGTLQYLINFTNIETHCSCMDKG